jgi:hypothetical protein
VSFTVQPNVVADDGTDLAPVSFPVQVVVAADWPAWAAEVWPTVLAEAQRGLDGNAGADDPG